LKFLPSRAAVRVRPRREDEGKRRGPSGTMRREVPDAAMEEAAAAVGPWPRPMGMGAVAAGTMVFLVASAGTMLSDLAFPVRD
jgi:hypothetical protein